MNLSSLTRVVSYNSRSKWQGTIQLAVKAVSTYTAKFSNVINQRREWTYQRWSLHHVTKTRRKSTFAKPHIAGGPYWEGPVPSPPEPPPAPEGSCPVCSYNEWDPLEEVVMGRAEGARIPHMDIALRASLAESDGDWFIKNAGLPLSNKLIQQAVTELNEFQRVLELEGVKVRRPEIIEYGSIGGFRTPDFETGGFHTAFPRDSLLVVGNEIIEATMSWRSRYFETWPFKELLNEYFRAGAKWTLAPKPRMTDQLYDNNYPLDDEQERTRLAGEGKYVLTEAEPCFDAADVVRFGRDLFVQISNVTNWGGVEWLRRHLAPEYRVHHLNFLDPYAVHIDATFVPLRAGFLLVNPERPCLQIDFFRKNGWEVVVAPEPAQHDIAMYASDWLSMNVLSLDEERVVISSHERPLADMLINHGFKPIMVKMEAAFLLGGAFHCLTCDVRRRGDLKSYFDIL